MMGKIPSAITEIRLNKATFSDVPVEQLTFVNFFYGSNGTGKSTIARAIAENCGVSWKHGTAADDFDVLVYNQDFIHRNFQSYANLPGVYTVNEANIQIQQEIQKKTEEKKHLEEQRFSALEEWRRTAAAQDALLGDFQTECWNKAAALREVFGKALEGKKQKKTFADAVLREADPQQRDIEELKRLYGVAFDSSARVYPEFSRVDRASAYGNLPGRDLLDKVTVSSSNTPFSQFMKALNATDWVRDGHARLTGLAGGKCPYCQQKLPPEFEEEIAACFDAQYQQDIRDLQQFQAAYASETAAIVRVLENNLTDVMPQIDITPYQAKLAMLKNSFQINNQRLLEKVREPARIVALEDTDSLLLETGGLIDEINLQIKANNDVVHAGRASKEKCRAQVMEHLAFTLSGEVESYYDRKAQLEREAEILETRGIQLKKEIAAAGIQLAELNAQTVNTEAAIASINTMLMESGLQGFRLRAREGVSNTYEVVRDGREEEGPVEDLSEGEQNFIAFLYFYHLVRGSLSSGGVKEKIVVIDDPVSGMDGTALFYVSSIVREMTAACLNNAERRNPKAPGGYIRQVFILTHNVHFHQEITYQQLAYYDRVSLYAVQKNENSSTVKLCERQNAALPSGRENYNPIQNSYAALWEELREVKSAVPAINVMRRILSYYFLQLCGYDADSLRETVLERHRDMFIVAGEDGRPDLTKYRLAVSLLAYSGSSQETSGIDFIESGRDIEDCKRVFQLIFQCLDQSRHYNMMTGTL